MEMSTMMMTVDDMRKTYPNMCIGITDVRFDNRHQIISGDVKYTDKSEEELIAMAIDHTGIRPFYTLTSEGGWSVGALMV